MFRTCWATPICSPSRAEIMTGRYGFRTRWFHNNMKPLAGQPGGNLSECNLIFAQLLKSAGYATAIAGKWQLRGTEREYGFDEKCMWEKLPGGGFDGPIEGQGASLPGRPARYWHPAIVKNGRQLRTTARDYGPDIFTDFVIDFARRHQHKPFLVYYPMALTHASWDFDLKKNTWVPTPELDEGGRRTGRKTKDTLRSNVEYMDHLVGRIARSLDKLGIPDNTVLIFTADNGTRGYGKSNLFQERGPRVPMIVNCPGLVRPLGPVDALTDLSDVLPTMAELAGIAPPGDYVIDGRSMAPVLRGQERHVRDWIFSFYADTRLLRDQRWLLDGNGSFWDCGTRRDEEGYKDVTDSQDPQVAAARRRFAKTLEGLPAPDTNDPLVRQWHRKRTRAKAPKRGIPRAKPAERD